jgi:hypothetical protein
MSHDAFISHAGADHDVAGRICAVLEEAGVRCWIAPRDIPVGSTWASEIIHAIEQSTVVVLVFSAGANRSQQVVREVDRAVSHGIPIVPFRIENVPFSKALEYFLSTCQWLDASAPPRVEHLQKLVEAVRLARKGPRNPRLSTPAPAERASAPPRGGARPSTTVGRAGLSRRAKRLSVLLLVTVTVLLALLFPTSLNPLAPHFSGYDTVSPDARLSPGRPSILRVRGTHLGWLGWTWKKSWLEALKAAGAAPQGPVTVDATGTVAQVEVTTAPDFDKRCLPAPSTILQSSEECFPIKLTFGISVALVLFKDDDLPEYQDLVRQAVTDVDGDALEHVALDREIHFDRYAQADFRTVASRLRDYDLVVASPFVYLDINRTAAGSSPPSGPPGESPLKLLACSRRERDPGKVEAQRSPNSYRSYLVTNPANKLGKALSTGPLQSPAQLLTLGDLGRIEVYGTNKGSASGYIVPCVEWEAVFSRLLPDSSWRFSGSPKDVLARVLDPDVSVVRLGALNSEHVDYRDLPPHKVVWKSDELPHGGLSIVTSMAPAKREILIAGVDRALSKLRDGKLTLHFSPNSDTNSIGVCNTEAYRNLEAYLLRSSASRHCDLGVFGTALPPGRGE